MHAVAVTILLSLLIAILRSVLASISIPVLVSIALAGSLRVASSILLARLIALPIATGRAPLLLPGAESFLEPLAELRGRHRRRLPTAGLASKPQGLPVHRADLLRARTSFPSLIRPAERFCQALAVAARSVGFTRHLAELLAIAARREVALHGLVKGSDIRVGERQVLPDLIAELRRVPVPIAVLIRRRRVVRRGIAELISVSIAILCARRERDQAEGHDEPGRRQSTQPSVPMRFHDSSPFAREEPRRLPQGAEPSSPPHSPPCIPHFTIARRA